MQEQTTLEPEQGEEQTDRRRHGRLQQNSLFSNIGPTLDLSAGGMRVLSTRRRKGGVEIYLGNAAGYQVQVQASVVWCKRIGFRRYLVGLEFLDLTENQARQLRAISITK